MSCMNETIFFHYCLKVDEVKNYISDSTTMTTLLTRKARQKWHLIFSHTLFSHMRETK